MYYHMRLGKFWHDGSEDMPSRLEWDFRSLRQGLTMLKRDFGADAQAWRIEDLTGRKADLMMLERELSDALMSTCQYVIMSFKDNSPLAKKYDHYQFFVVACDEAERPPSYSFSEEDELAIAAPEAVFQPDYRQSVKDILASFALEEGFADCLTSAVEEVADYYGDEADTPDDVLAVKSKEEPDAADYILIADECRDLGEEQMAVMLYVSALGFDGPNVKIGEALAKLAELYMDSDWPVNGGRELDVMKAVDLLVESLRRGYGDARSVAEGMRKQLFEDYVGDEELDVEDITNRYEVDALCFAGFCLGIGLGWKKDTVKAAKLFEYALAQGYGRASHYLNEIRTGRV